MESTLGVAQVVGGEGYIDLSSEEKALAWWDANCQPAPDQANTVGVAAVLGEECKKCDLRHMDQVFGGSGPAGITLISKVKAESIVKQNRKNPHVVPPSLHYSQKWSTEELFS